MRTDAPGKLVLSGAYAVLRGAPAIVTAVNRRVTADTERPANYSAPEVEAGLSLLEHNHELPYYDASALRSSEDKLGLGSSAAICVSSLGALLAEEHPHLTIEELRRKLYPLARQAHRKAQGGGSGIDVAAACFGKTHAARQSEQDRGAPPSLEEVALPSSLVIEVWGSSKSASTAHFVRQVFDLENTCPSQFVPALHAQHTASEDALLALRAGDTSNFVQALRKQLYALKNLGDLAELPIVDDTVLTLAQCAGDATAFLPSGAGGGDVCIYVGQKPSSEEFRQHARGSGLFLVPLSLQAEGFRTLEGNV